MKPFIGCDGEGAGEDRQHRQHYQLLRCGDQELFTGRPLGLVECLEHILAQPDTEHAILVGYSFGYDATQILRHLPPDALRNEVIDSETGEVLHEGNGLFDPVPLGINVRYTYHGSYGIEYIPNVRLRVCRVAPTLHEASGTFRTRAIPGTSRTIYDVFGFFRRPFLSALKAFGIGAEHWPMLERMKKNRGSQRKITPEIRRYCAIECSLLAQLMEKFREHTYGAGMRPNEWSGAGKLANYLHRQNGTMDNLHVQMSVPKIVRDFASEAYYAGRFEVTRHGLVESPVYQYDKRSAFAAAMVNLPCLAHGKWHRADGERLVQATLAGELFIARVRFNQPSGPLCGLPMRAEDGRLAWPRQGGGVYWSCELRAARALGMTINFAGGYVYEKCCTCCTFQWIEALYQARQALGPEQGEPIKVALAALYGKLAQRRYGVPRYHNLIHAGLVTARVRAELLEAIRQAPEAIVMLASDGIFSLAPLSLPIGDNLGEWRQEAVHPRLFIVQPGLFWSPDKQASRGIPSSVWAEHKGTFERAWRRYVTKRDAKQHPPSVVVPIRLFVGLRYAALTGRSDAGRWLVENNGKGRELSFSWSLKRDRPLWEGDAIATAPIGGGPDLESVPYDPIKMEALDARQLAFGEQQDMIDLSPP